MEETKGNGENVNKSAIEMYQKNGHFVVLEVPSGTEFGIDMKVYETGPEFRGIKMIPPGLHFVTYGARGGGGKQGLFFEAKPGEVEVRSWDAHREELAGAGGPALPPAALANLAAAVHRFELDRQLGAYPAAAAQRALWGNLANWVTTEVLSDAGLSPGVTVLPGCAEEAELEAELAAASGGGATGRAKESSSGGGGGQEARVVEEDSGGGGGGDGGGGGGGGRVPVFFDVRGGRVTDRALAPAALTAANLDKTPRLLAALQERFGGQDARLLGQVQLAFLLFLGLESLPALRHWERLAHLVCHAHALPAERPALLAAFARVLLAQLGMLPEDFFEADISKDNFLGPALSDLFESLSEPDLNPQLRKILKKLLEYVQERFGLFTDIDDALPAEMAYCLDPEYLPTVVEELSDALDAGVRLGRGDSSSSGSGGVAGVRPGGVLGGGGGGDGKRDAEGLAVADRWRAIDQALSRAAPAAAAAAAPPDGMMSPSGGEEGGAGGERVSVGEVSGPDSDDEDGGGGGSGGGAAGGAAGEGRAAAAAAAAAAAMVPGELMTRYPKLVRCIDPARREDVFMTAARLCSGEFQLDSTFNALAQQEAIKFLEEEVQNKQSLVNQASFWQKSQQQQKQDESGPGGQEEQTPEDDVLMLPENTATNNPPPPPPFHHL